MQTADAQTLLQPAPSSTRTHLEITLEGDASAPRVRPLAEQRVVVGRAAGLEVVLDHHTVSRRHAELLRDPFGRHWIRDLGSTNGTTVNGELVRERVLRPGDRIRVGDFRLVFQVSQAQPFRPSAVPIHEGPEPSEAPSWTRSLRDLEPPRISTDQLGTIMQLSRRLLELESAQDRLGALLDVCVSDAFHASLASVLRLTPAHSARVLAGPRRPAHLAGHAAAPYYSSGVLRRVLEAREPTLGSNLGRPGTQNLELTLSASVSPLASLACPLGSHAGASSEAGCDVLYCNFPPHFGSSEWLALLSLAAEAYQQADSVWSARREAQQHAVIERELETARRIQQGLLPRALQLAELDVHFGFSPCRWVGGDYVDAITIGDGRLLCIVADVCGKGLQAALVTSSIHTLLHALATDGLPISTMLERLDAHLGAYLPEDSFVTLVATAFDPRSGEVECVNAGHLPPIVLDPRGRVRRLQAAENPALGLGLGRVALESERSELGPGETLALYTDGLTELGDPSGEMFGEERLAHELSRLVVRAPRSTSAELARGLESALDAFRGDSMPADDRTFLLARRKLG